MNETLGKRMGRLLKDHELSIRAAADIAGVASSTMANWLNGCTPKDFLALYRLANHLNVSLSYLLIGQDDSPTKRPPCLEDVLHQSGEVIEGLYEIRIRRLERIKREDS